MEKTIVIDGKEVRLKSNASCQRRYKMQFRREVLKDVFKLKKLEKYIKDGKLEASDEIIAEIDFDIFYDLLWVFAKTANKTIPDPLEWEEQFERIPIREVFPVVVEMLTSMLDSVKKN
ncbi:hypothetical protein MTP04_22400 [Lysinibacillus sp. PLM2]|nr:hypothetical protein D7X33_25925 [Butyricicoccus sp. 1XD8-22]BDH62110.1 hypothetical protein MTP04_22400 [Lysinibacillus sp. PLM2]